MVTVQYLKVLPSLAENYSNRYCFLQCYTKHPQKLLEILLNIISISAIHPYAQ